MIEREELAPVKMAGNGGARPAPGRRLRIAQLAPLAEAVPPQGYGGTERVVSVLTEELVARGHQVTLFAAGDSRTSARLVSAIGTSLRPNGMLGWNSTYTMVQMDQVLQARREFDVIHNHVEYSAYPAARLPGAPIVSTTHGRLDLPEIRQAYGHFPDVPLISISRAQQATLPQHNWLATVYNGIDFARLNLRRNPGSYLAFVGRISPEKRPDRAVEIAKRVGMRLLIAAKVGDADHEYFNAVIKPLLSDPLVEFIGEIGDEEKDALLGNAWASLFPIDWPEPFGLSMVESMACGTPVIAMACGSVPEVVEDGVSGFVCRSMDEMEAAVPRAGTIDRARCRAAAERRFSASAMADGYEQAYRLLLSDQVRYGAAAAAVSVPRSAFRLDAASVHLTPYVRRPE
jgi:glycosyltransferase involved in cell wall biosynthesis